MKTVLCFCVFCFAGLVPSARAQYTSGSGDGYASGSASMGTLPVVWTALAATADGPDVLLTWQTASEINNAGFEIQRISENAGANDRPPEWEDVAFVDGYGTTEEAQAYRYRVENMEPGHIIFRLKQIDFDGTFVYSPEVEVVVDMPGRFVVEPAYPNPFNPMTQFRFAVKGQHQVYVDLYDMLGRRVKRLYEGEPTAGQMHTVRIDGRDLSSGLYLVRVAGKGFVETRTVTLLK